MSVLLEFGKPEPGVFMRTSWALTAKTPLTLPSGDCVRFFTDRDADKLVQRVRKRNVFARHSWENSFYLNRIRQLAHSLSERAAFILSPMPEKRRRISKIVRKFYDARSGVVHGSRDKVKLVSSELLETTDRLVIMLNLNYRCEWKGVVFARDPARMV